MYVFLLPEFAFESEREMQFKHEKQRVWIAVTSEKAFRMERLTKSKKISSCQLGGLGLVYLFPGVVSWSTLRMISEFKVRLLSDKQSEFGFAEVFSVAFLSFCEFSVFFKNILWESLYILVLNKKIVVV